MGNKRKTNIKKYSKKIQKSIPPKINFQRPDSNMRLSITFVPEFPQCNSLSLIERHPSGLPGIYKITYVLCIPGKEIYRSELDMNKIIKSGESLLFKGKGMSGKVTLYNENDLAEIQFLTNKHGNLSMAQIRINASSFKDAEKLAHNLVYPSLSHLSFKYDVALEITGHQVVEEETGTIRGVFGMIGKVKTMNLSELSSTPYMSNPLYRLFFSTYRDALNATNVFYQILCFYKVIEGVRKARLKRKIDTLEAGVEYREPFERVPELEGELPISDEMFESFKPYLGKKFSYILDQYRELFRNTIAHLDPEKDELISDRYEFLISCEIAVPVIKYICRVMLQNEIIDNRSII